MSDDIKIISFSEEFTLKHQDEILQIDYDAFKDTPPLWKIENFLMKLPHKEQLSFYAVQGDTGKGTGKVVGYLLGASHGKSASYLNRVATDKNIRGAGIGKKLVQHFLDVSKKLGFTETLLSMHYDKNNEYLFKFYENFGYTALKSKEDIVKFLESKNKADQLELFYPAFAEGKYLILGKSL